MGRLWQAAATVRSVLRPGLLETAAASGLRSLFVGFESLNQAGLLSQKKHHNVQREYMRAVRRLHDMGIMINASFVFGLDGDDRATIDRTVEWAISQGLETATFHILTPYPGTALHQRLAEEGRITTANWDLYDTRHVVYRPAKMTAETLEVGYWRAYQDFYRWRSILQGAWTKKGVARKLRHLAYAGGWKKFEPLWNLLIRQRQAFRMLPLLEAVLSSSGKRRERADHLLTSHSTAQERELA